MASKPTVQEIAAIVSGGDGVETTTQWDVGADTTITITVKFDQSVNVNTSVPGVAPSLNLNDGGVATYVSGSGTDTLTFTYTVAAGENKSALKAKSGANWGTITGTSGGKTASAFGDKTLLDNGKPINVDTSHPTVGLLDETGDTATANPTLTGTVAQPGETVSLTLTNGSSTFTASTTADANGNWTYTPVGLTDGVYSVTASDANGTSSALTFQLLAAPPVVTGVSVVTTNGLDLDAGQTVTITLTWNEAVTVTGNVKLGLNDGGTATYLDGSGTDTLRFTYTVKAGENTADLAITGVTYNAAGTVENETGVPASFNNAINVTLSGPIIVDTVAPRITDITAAGTSANYPLDPNEFKAGKVITFSVKLSEVVTVAGGTPTLLLNDGEFATYQSGSGSDTLVFTYTVQAGDTSSALKTASTGALALNGAAITDLAGNAAILTGANNQALKVSGSTIIIDTSVPTITGATISPAESATLHDGKAVKITLDLSEDVIDAGISGSSITLSNGATATYVSGYGTNKLVYQYTVAAGPTQNTVGVRVTGFNFNGVVYDLAGNPLTPPPSLDVTCFMPGTLVRTPDGERAVESLSIGDLVLTAAGEAQPVTWIGRQTVSRVFSDPLRVLPIRIAAGALDDNLPVRDLLLSPDHALLVDGVLIQAGALVNGSTIRREYKVPTVFTYYHVELAGHALILAEGTPAETFVDNVDRMGFDNWAEHLALYPQGQAIEEMPLPRAKSHRQVPMATRARLARRTAELTGTAAAA